MPIQEAVRPPEPGWFLACPPLYHEASVSSKRVLYVWQAPYPWDIRVEKICAGLARAGYEVQILARRGNETDAVAAINGFTVHRVGPGPGIRRLRPLSLPMPGNPLWAAALKKRIQE